MPAQPILDAKDQSIIAQTIAERNLSIFTDFYFKPERGYFSTYPGAVRHAQYLARWRELGKPRSFEATSAGITFEVTPRYDGPELVFDEHRGFLFLPWQTRFWQSEQKQKVVVGTPGTGKTLGLGLMGITAAALAPHFRFLNVAPTLYQSGLMTRSINEFLPGTRYATTFLKPGKKGYREKPYSTFFLNNNSTAEYMNVERNAKNVQSWSGDWINMDEAGLNDKTDDQGQVELGSMMIGLATRLRGQRPDGRPRLGWLTMISMAYDNDALWEIVDIALANPKTYFCPPPILFKENPYLTPAQIKFFKDNTPRGEEPQWLEGKRPAKKGAEFHPRMLESLFAAELSPEARTEEGAPGVVVYEIEPKKDHVYVMSGDPGHSDPPFRNAPVIFVWDVTNFPYQKATLACFWWGYGNGSILPFTTKFDEYMTRYQVPISLRGYDSTSSQKALAELAWQTGGETVTPLGFDGAKKWMYINAAKTLMSKDLIIAPPIAGFKTQMGNYKLPDKKLVQDIVSAFCMSCHLMIPLYRDVYPEEPEPTAVESSDLAARLSRSYRPPIERHPGRTR
jgi:hypothetical protein